jgi:hypothetical protein
MEVLELLYNFVHLKRWWFSSNLRNRVRSVHRHRIDTLFAAYELKCESRLFVYQQAVQDLNFIIGDLSTLCNAKARDPRVF